MPDQRLMQASSDIFLGWGHGLNKEMQYYWLQLKDVKGPFDTKQFDA